MQITSIQIPSIRWSVLRYALVWLVILSVLFLPRVVNHTETEDAYSYALELVEKDQWAELVHDHHKIYHIICYEIYGFTRLSFTRQSRGLVAWVSRVGHSPLRDPLLEPSERILHLRSSASICGSFTSSFTKSTVDSARRPYL